MKNDDVVVAVGLILLAMTNNAKKTIPWGTGWQWPIPDVHVSPAVLLRAVISQEFRGKGDRDPHYGVDLMYRNPAPPPSYAVPDGVPVMSARAGTLWSVQHTARGWCVVVEHGPAQFATFYQHLSRIDPLVMAGRQGVARKKPDDPPPMAIGMGQVLGLVGADPTDPSHVRHLHFAVWYQGAGDAASIDPSSAMATWGRASWMA